MFECFLKARNQFPYFVDLVASKIQCCPRHHVWHVSTEIDLDEEGRICCSGLHHTGLENPATDQNRAACDSTLLRHHVVLIVVRTPGMEIRALGCLVGDRVTEEVSA